MKRSSGILLHISSLPSPYGIGTLGRAARDFVDFLARARQSYWQILPITPTGYGDSPYQSASSFAGNPYFIDPDALLAQGLLTEEELAGAWGETPEKTDYGMIYNRRWPMLRTAYTRFCAAPDAGFAKFCAEEAHWLEDYALFMAVKSSCGGKPWLEWEEDIRLRRPEALAAYRQKLAADIGFQQWIQYVFYTQWQALRDYAGQKGISIIGDIPIYVPVDSAEVWSDPDCFQLDENRRPKVVAGCPPDGFNADGQYWGNPIYDWEKMKEDGFRWWIRRMGAAVRFFDVVRIDHFRGIESYWSIPASHTTARNGKWVKGPGLALINAIQAAYPKADFIAEDLGFLTPAVVKMVKDSGFPSMKVLQFAFGTDETNEYLPHLYTNNCICYTGTHDNMTLRQWYENAVSGDPDLVFARKYMKLTERADFCKSVIRLGMDSKADLFMAQMQDYLDLGEAARMNEPGAANGKNWCWRMLPGAATDALADEIAAWTVSAKRA